MSDSLIIDNFCLSAHMSISNVQFRPPIIFHNDSSNGQTCVFTGNLTLKKIWLSMHGSHCVYCVRSKWKHAPNTVFIGRSGLMFTLHVLSRYLYKLPVRYHSTCRYYPGHLANVGSARTVIFVLLALMVMLSFHYCSIIYDLLVDLRDILHTTHTLDYHHRLSVWRREKK